MKLPRSFAPPTVQTEEGEGDRHATWLELFFDLVFVVAVATLAHDLAGDVTGIRIVAFVGLFVPVFLLWMNFSYYADLFGERGLDRVGLFGVAALSTTLHDALGGALTNFVLVYLALRVVLVALYGRAWLANPGVRGFLGRYVALYGLAALFWLASLAFSGILQYALIGVGLAVEVATPATAYFTAEDRPQQVSHMPERFGLFTIIVLGEVVVAVVSGLGDTEWSATAFAASVGAFVASVAVWRLYFANVRESTITDLVTAEEFDFFGGMGYTYGHFGVTLGITALGAGVLLVIVAAAEGHDLGRLERLLVGGGIAVYLLGTLVTHGAVGALASRAFVARGGAGVVALAVAVAGTTPLVLVLVVAGVLSVVALYEGIPTATAPAIERAG